jgi:hypothetical protein
MRGFMLLIGLAFFSASFMAPAWAAKLGETCDGIAGVACDDGLWCEHPEGGRAKSPTGPAPVSRSRDRYA